MHRTVTDMIGDTQRWKGLPGQLETVLIELRQSPEVKCPGNQDWHEAGPDWNEVDSDGDEEIGSYLQSSDLQRPMPQKKKRKRKKKKRKEERLE